ncbi:hypothetical protein EIP91_007406 [Steccherinum ochraceum]|uniref:Uncharacterized protein n=1 Tax=Steccherinum ochraceum TaxID=92696 RepID=A0A4R0RZ38_9APHY|nr:hypothetical protein EIP91_007406 [Steccherinum ochraceum]
MTFHLRLSRPQTSPRLAKISSRREFVTTRYTESLHFHRTHLRFLKMLYHSSQRCKRRVTRGFRLSVHPSRTIRGSLCGAAASSSVGTPPPSVYARVCIYLSASGISGQMHMPHSPLDH